MLVLSSRFKQSIGCALLECMYELQDRLKEAGKLDVKAYACYLGASSTSLIRTSGSLMTRLIWQIIKLTPMVQSAEKGAYPQLMCATEPDLDQTAFYGPTQRMNTEGAVGAHKLEPHAKDKVVSEKLWKVSESSTNFVWNI